MKKLFMLALIGLFLAMVAQAEAVEPGDVGSIECGNVQFEAQEAVLNGMPYRNHGQMVRTAAKVVSEYVCIEEVITYECASCIMNQFARMIPIEEQEPCGIPPRPECEPATCETFIPCEQGPDGCIDPVCVSTSEGQGYCVEGRTPCAGLLDCVTSADCGSGEVCAVNTCCIRNVCVPADAFCPPPEGASSEVPESASSEVVDGPTIGSPY